jgi:hypothetical protein
VSLGKTSMLKKANKTYGYGASAISTPKMMARGGVVGKPTLAMIGEEGPEAVIPLGRSKKAKKNARRVAKKVIEKTAMHMAMPMPPRKSPEFDDKHMLLQSLKAIEGMAKEMQKEIVCGCEMPSWVEYKIYKAKDSLLSAVGYTYSINKQAPARMAIKQLLR